VILALPMERQSVANGAHRDEGATEVSMNYQLKSISKAGIAEALAKVELYRYLNEPEESESICRDILAVDSQQQLALRLLGLSITDQFTGGLSDRCQEAEELFQRLTDRYEQLYYKGILQERRAKAQLRAGQLPHAIYPLLERALQCFAEAEKIRPTGNDDAILRWNRCVRLLQTPSLAWEEQLASFEADDAPPR
jgi:tetratricopeptide (TPR) repeat protein